MSSKKHKRRDGRAPLDAEDLSFTEASHNVQTPIFTEEADNTHRQGHRHARLQTILRVELDALLRDDVRDPLLYGITVTSVELSIDYRNARVYVRFGADSDPRKAALALEKATAFLRANLSDALDLKFVPSLRFSAHLYPDEEG